MRARCGDWDELPLYEVPACERPAGWPGASASLHHLPHGSRKRMKCIPSLACATAAACEPGCARVRRQAAGIPACFERNLACVWPMHVGRQAGGQRQAHGSLATEREERAAGGQLAEWGLPGTHADCFLLSCCPALRPISCLVSLRCCIIVRPALLALIAHAENFALTSCSPPPDAPCCCSAFRRISSANAASACPPRSTCTSRTLLTSAAVLQHCPMPAPPLLPATLSALPTPRADLPGCS